MIIQAYTTFFSSLIIGFCKGWKLTLVILAVTPVLGLIAIINNKVSVTVSVLSLCSLLDRFLSPPSHHGVFPRVDADQAHCSRAECSCQRRSRGRGGAVCCPDCVCLQRSEEKDSKVNTELV